MTLAEMFRAEIVYGQNLGSAGPEKFSSFELKN
jgi:hypothetical protein